ncbi:MAG: Holliday junction resolvase RuvX [Planctomycetaceae bacterium]|jgi:putative Holliday junction resolvase|nr:Holliday junction resolvase RuvX [Planctomycetaceae bacterium]
MDNSNDLITGTGELDGLVIRNGELCIKTRVPKCNILDTQPPFPAAGSVAGIDYGTVRIGIAVSDAGRVLASPYKTYVRKTPQQDAGYFKQLVSEEQITQFVVGLPLHLSGDVSPKAKESQQFGRWLNELTGIPVDYFDERYTSVEAERLLRDANLTNKKRKDRRDKLAAQILLTAYLEAGCKGTETFESIDN